MEAVLIVLLFLLAAACLWCQLKSSNETSHDEIVVRTAYTKLTYADAIRVLTDMLTPRRGIDVWKAGCTAVQKALRERLSFKLSNLNSSKVADLRQKKPSMLQIDSPASLSYYPYSGSREKVNRDKHLLSLASGVRRMSSWRSVIVVPIWALCIYLSSFAATHSVPHQSIQAVAQQTSQAGKEAQEQEKAFQRSRETFGTARKLLQDQNVPFDPDDLLRHDWTKRLKNALDGMHEMHQSRYETKPLNGAYIADTLYLPEKVQLTGHTVILANYLVFEGHDAIIRGGYELHVFPGQQVAVLDGTLAELLQKQPGLMNVSLTGKPVLPSFSVLRNVLLKSGRTKHTITFDISGAAPEPPQKPLKLKPALQSASWAFEPMLPQSGDINKTPKETGQPGTPGPPGTPGDQGPHPPRSINGDCTNPAGGSNNGHSGQAGGDGSVASDGGPGGPGSAGFNAGDILDIYVPDTDTNAYVYIANGGDGGKGGPGGQGGRGGDGGLGGDGGDGVACGCQLGRGGIAGVGGDGRIGGKGGPGGTGGSPGGRGGTIRVSLPWNTTGPAGTPSNRGGAPGQAGDPGFPGGGGSPGHPGQPGSGATECGNNGGGGDVNSFGNVGPPGSFGDPGHPGAQVGENGPPPKVIPRPGPDTPPGGGGPPNPCDFDPSSPDCCDPNNFTPTPKNGCPPLVSSESPIIIDTEGEGFQLTSMLDGVIFDMSGDGHPLHIAWTALGSRNAFLALPGTDGQVHTGKQLFGNFTDQPPSEHPNGFLALAQFDKKENGGNGDGIIDERDAVFAQLRLWIDENHDGISQPEELHKLPELGVYSLSLDYTESRRKDGFGNQFRYRARVNPDQKHRDPRDTTPSGEPGRWTYDVFLTLR